MPLEVISVKFRLEDHIEDAMNAAYQRDEAGAGDSEGMAVSSGRKASCCVYRDLCDLNENPPSILKDGPAYLLGPLGTHPSVVSFDATPAASHTEPPGQPHSPSAPAMPIASMPSSADAPFVAPFVPQTALPCHDPRPPSAPAPSVRNSVTSSAGHPLSSPSSTAGSSVTQTSSNIGHGPTHLPPSTPEHPGAIKAPSTRKRKKKPGRVAREKNRSKRTRKAKRAFLKEFFLPMTNEKVFDSHPFSDTDIIETDLSRDDLDRTGDGGWLAKRTDYSKIDRSLRTLNDYLKAGYTLVEWDGYGRKVVVEAPEYEGQPVQDRRIIVILAGRPIGDASYNAAVSTLGKDITHFRTQLEFGRYQTIPVFNKNQTENRRGDFELATWGISLGTGSEQPGNLVHTPENAKAIAEFEKRESLQRVSDWASNVFSNFAPKFHRLYANTLTSLYLVHSEELHPPVKGSVFPAISVNFPSSSTVCEPHRDNGNLADGFCWVLAGGSFDSKRGGHLVLHELNLVVEFPAGASILFPSSVITHSNTAIAEDESRWSVTQFAAGGLFRWVEYGYHTMKKLEKKHKRIAAKIAAERPHLWRPRLGLLSSISSLRNDREEMRRVCAVVAERLRGLEEFS